MREHPKSEADLEARIHSVLNAAFPWLTSKSLAHQPTFSVRLGRIALNVSGRETQQLSGRADVLVSANGKPLAIVELKREGGRLTEADTAQGLSYARLTTPMPPLVIISNGTDTQIYETYSGEKWRPTDRTEQEFDNRIVAVGKIAAAGLSDAVNTLMGSNQRHWVPALREISTLLIEERTGSWIESTAPFVRDFLIPRKVTQKVASELIRGSRAIVVHGPPLSGKSNVIRELCETTLRSTTEVVLMLEPDDAGIFGAISHLLSSELGWNASANEAREWLRTISNSKGSKLIIALDGVDPLHSSVLADLNELSSGRFGRALRLLVAIDDSTLNRITKKRNGREHTAFGRIAREIPLAPLCDEEFEQAIRVLARNRISITRGGESVLSLREPWILRALVPSTIDDLPPPPSNLVVRLPPLLDVESLYCAADSIDLDSDTETSLRAVASAILDQYLEPQEPAEMLHRMSTFSVDKHRLEQTVFVENVRELGRRGFLKSGFDWANHAVWFVRVPTLVARQIALVLADRISSWGGSDEVADRLIFIASRLPLGGVIAASAVLERIKTHPGNDASELISELFRQAPTRSSLTVGTELAFAFENGMLRARVTDRGTLALVGNGAGFEIDLDEGETVNALSTLGGWLILSHIVCAPLGILLEGKTEPTRIDGALLLEVGQATEILSQTDGAQDFKGIAIHQLEGHGDVVCHLAGVVEPITWALMQFFLREGEESSDWIDEAIRINSLPLLNRIYIALSEIVDATGQLGIWAQAMLADRVQPAMAELPLFHQH